MLALIRPKLVVRNSFWQGDLFQICVFLQMIRCPLAVEFDLDPDLIVIVSDLHVWCMHAARRGSKLGIKTYYPIRSYMGVSRYP